MQFKDVFEGFIWINKVFLGQFSNFSFILYQNSSKNYLGVPNSGCSIMAGSYCSSNNLFFLRKRFS